MPLEHDFQKNFKKRLHSIEGCWHFTKEALALRGFPDIMGCYNGRFFAMELKRSEKEAQKKTGRIVLQRHVLRAIRKAGGLAWIAYPENADDVLEQLINLNQITFDNC